MKTVSALLVTVLTLTIVAIIFTKSSTVSDTMTAAFGSLSRWIESVLS